MRKKANPYIRGSLILIKEHQNKPTRTLDKSDIIEDAMAQLLLTNKVICKNTYNLLMDLLRAPATENGYGSVEAAMVYYFAQYLRAACANGIAKKIKK